MLKFNKGLDLLAAKQQRWSYPFRLRLEIQIGLYTRVVLLTKLAILNLTENIQLC